MYRRYADPMGMIGMMLRFRRLCSFIDEVIRLRNEEEEEKLLWEIWLHRVHNMGYAEFKKSLTESMKTEEQRQEDLTQAVSDSFRMLQGFQPEENEKASQPQGAVMDNGG